MHARMTRYEGAAPDAIEENLQAKKGVLPTEFGQTEGMKGIVFLVDRQGGTVVVISLWTRRRCGGARMRRRVSARKSRAPARRRR